MRAADCATVPCAPTRIKLSPAAPIEFNAREFEQGTGVQPIRRDHHAVTNSDKGWIHACMEKSAALGA